MNSKGILGLFLVVAAIQLAVPLGQIWRYEDVLRTGAVYKFRTAPVDPYDAFRGRYLALNYADTVATVTMRPDTNLRSGARAFVSLQQDADGFARFGALTGKPPAEGDYLRVEFLWGGGAPENEAHFRLPFDRFFMEETLAPRAEAAYLEHANRGNLTDTPTYVLVRVKQGRGVIEDLYIRNVPVREFLAGETGDR